MRTSDRNTRRSNALRLSWPHSSATRRMTSHAVSARASRANTAYTRRRWLKANSYTPLEMLHEAASTEYLRSTGWHR